MNIQEKVILFFNEWGIYHNKLKNKTIINDINQDYMDLEWLFESFFKEFNIKNSHTFDVSKYFYKISFFNKVLIELGFKVYVQSKPPIIIEHMIEVAKRKEWFDPE